MFANLSHVVAEMNTPINVRNLVADKSAQKAINIKAYLYAGTAPNASAFDTADYYALSTLLTMMSSAGNQLIWENVFLSVPCYVEGNELHLDFASANYQAAASTSGVSPTFCLLVFNSDLALTGNSHQGYTPMILTVGNESSDADIKIYGGQIPVGQVFTLNNITASIVGLGG